MPNILTFVVDKYWQKHSTVSNLFHLLCSTGLHALGFGVLHGPTVAYLHVKSKR